MPTKRSGCVFWVASSVIERVEVVMTMGFLGRHPAVELAQDLAFEPEVLLDRFEGEITVGGAVVMGDPGDPRQ